MKSTDEFLSLIMPSAPGCPHPSAHQAIIQAAIELCESTKLWRDRDSFSVTTAGSAFVCVPDGAELVEFNAPLLDGEPLEPIPLAELDDRMPDWETATGPGRWVTQIDMDTLRVVPACNGRVTIRTVLKPAQDADMLPAFLADKYRRLIADGALGHILLLPGQNFTDPTMAQFYMNRFEQGIRKLISLKTQGQQRAPARTKPHFL